MDMMLINGKVYTMNQNDDVYEAVAIDDGIISALDTTDNILERRTDDTRIIDLKGDTVISGLNDSHMHFLSFGYSQRRSIWTDAGV